MAQPAPVVILGCGRSGTSIFGELFDELDPYSYRSEPPFSEVLESHTENISAVKVPKESAEFPPDIGLSFPLDILLDAQPSTVFFWIVRHPLDAISSLRIGIQRDWGHHPRPPDWKDWLDRSLVERCAHHWSYINEHGFERIGTRAVLVRFEDMISDPQSFATNVCTQVGLSPFDHNNTLRIWSDRVQNTNNKKFREAETSRSYSRPDHAVRVGRWRENLSDEEARSAARIVSRANQHFDYDLFGLNE